MPPPQSVSVSLPTMTEANPHWGEIASRSMPPTMAAAPSICRMRSSWDSRSRTLELIRPITITDPGRRKRIGSNPPSRPRSSHSTRKLSYGSPANTASATGSSDPSHIHEER